MRASDIVKGKDMSLKEKKQQEDQSLAPVNETADLGKNKPEAKSEAKSEASYRLSGIAEELSFKPLPKSDGIVDLEGTAPSGEEHAVDISEEGKEEAPDSPAEENKPKISRIEPEYRLSDFDILNLISAKKETITARIEMEETVPDGALPAADLGQASPKTDHPATAEASERGTPPLPEAPGMEAQIERAAYGAFPEEESTATSDAPAEEMPPETASASVPPASDEALEPDCLPGSDIEAFYRRTQSYLQELQNRVKDNLPLDVQSAIAVVQNITDILQSMDSEIFLLTVNSGHDEDYYFSHAINTAIYAMKIGQRLGYSERQLLELGLSALLCDVGMFRIPDHILNKQGRLSAGEIDLIKSHPELSREVLLPLKKDFPAVIEAVYQHQERENGQGYPRGISGDDISEYAKIIGICDSYEAMTHHRPHKKALMQTASIRELIGSKNQLFSPAIIKVFLDEISIFPVGSYVRLNNRNIGCVMATNRSNPLKPTIKILYDETGKKFSEPRIVDLKAVPVLNIEESIAPDELPL